MQLYFGSLCSAREATAIFIAAALERVAIH
jgi:hypothetical protein